MKIIYHTVRVLTGLALIGLGLTVLPVLPRIAPEVTSIMFGLICGNAIVGPIVGVLILTDNRI